MKLLRSLLLFSAGLLLAQPQPASDPVAVARKALDLLLAQNYPDFSALMSAQLKANITAEQFAKFGVQLKSWGAVDKIADPVVRDMGPLHLITFPVSFASQNINFQFGINASGMVARFVFVPGQSAWQRPPYSKPDSFKERPVTVGEGEWQLPGTLAVPNGSGPFPAALLVAGFGPRDRDNTNEAIKVFRDLSEGLASRGIVVLRYEKRTRVYASRMAGHSYTTDDETTDDALAALTALRAQPEVDARHVFLVGHDLGGYLAPEIAQDDEKLAGVVIMGANVRPLEDAMLEMLQAMGATAKDLQSAKEAVARVKALEQADADGPPLMGLPVTYWLDLKGYDPAAVAKSVNVPFLILEGERDFQVPMRDFNLWKTGLAGRKDVTLRSYPALNHLFVAGTGPSNQDEYKKPGHVAAEVVDDIAKFMGR